MTISLYFRYLNFTLLKYLLMMFWLSFLSHFHYIEIFLHYVLYLRCQTACNLLVLNTFTYRLVTWTTWLYLVCILAFLDPTAWMWWRAVYLVWTWTQSMSLQIPSLHMLRSFLDFLCLFSCFKVLLFDFTFLSIKTALSSIQTVCFPCSLRVFSFLSSSAGAPWSFTIPQVLYYFL